MARSSPVPEGKLSRLAGLGAMVGSFALGGLAEGARRLVGRSDSKGSVFLTAGSAVALARRLSRMRGAAMKLGQLLSLQGADLVPPEFAQALALLRDSADTMPASQLRGVLGREYGRGWERRFAHLDLEPIASASIGQVHAARAADGRELALKIQYPGVAKSIDSDLGSLAALLRLTHVLPVDIDAGGMLAEAREQLHREADYLAEGESLRRYRRLVADAEPGCVVPGVHPDLTTKRILAMDRMRGIPLEQFMQTPGRREQKDQAGQLLLRLFLRELFEFRFVQTDPNFANYLFDEETGRLVLLDLGGARAYESDLTEQARRLLDAGRSADRARVLKVVREMGFMGEDEPEARVTALVDMALLVAEPLHVPGRFDFGTTDLAARVNRARLDLVLRQGYVRAPPGRTLFLLRKFAGVYFLLARLGARIDVRGLVAPFLPRARR